MTVMDNNADISGEFPAEVEEPPEKREDAAASTESARLEAAFRKYHPPAFERRESLLTRQLHSPEPEHTDDEHYRARAVVRGMSNWSNISVASTASLTSDNDVTSPGTRDSTPSPPLFATILHSNIPTLEGAHAKEPVVASHVVAESPEKTVEAGLGRRRCITFACGKTPNETPAAKEVTKETPQPEQKPAEAPKRKCAITFACPARPTIVTSPMQQRAKTARNSSPPPSKSLRPPPSPRPMPKAHRGSDSTVKNDSPKSIRKVPSTMMRRRKYSDDNHDVPAEERRFHEFGPLQAEAEQWLEESTCHRNRLTVNDTLIKETLIRRIGEEAEEEALEDEDEDELDDDEEDEDEDDDDLIDEEDVEPGASDDEVSDAGFQTDDEGGFAQSDSEDESGSDNEWWTAGRSTAATSADHIEHIRHSPRQRATSQSSMESADGERRVESRPPPGMGKRKTKAMRIHRPVTPDLPDSTDFVCGTLDEDRPLEQAYISCLEQRKAARYKARPQDIDPTFPTSDPEMDEEDDDSDSDDNKVDESDHPYFLHGKIDMHGEDSEIRGRQPSIVSTKKKSPSPPHQRLRSPPPAKRVVHRSPPPPAKRTTLRSPPPSKRTSAKSPPPAKSTSNRSKSPAPSRCVSGQTSPRRLKSPAPQRRFASPPPSRRPSPKRAASSRISFAPADNVEERRQPTHTASLPRVSSAVKLGRNLLAPSVSDREDAALSMNTRGAIDIVKGLEKKRQRRREKLYQKHCNRAGKDREHKRPKPGKGAERMRELGLELAAYKGHKKHMLSY